MNYRKTAQKMLMGALCLIAIPSVAQDAKVKPLLTKDLAGIPGKEGVMLTVEYAPGAKSAKHRHNANTFVYVLEGSIVMAVDGGKEVTLGPGETFYESPTDIHSVSRNASDSKPAKFLVFFVKDKGAPPTVPADYKDNRLRNYDSTLSISLPASRLLRRREAGKEMDKVES